jgi:HEAT repeat protein
MAFYDLPKEERNKLVEQFNTEIISELKSGSTKVIISTFSDEDTYIRKTAYLAIGRIYLAHKELQKKILALLEKLLKGDDFKIRQTVINAAGEIGKTDFETIQHFLNTGLFDKHHSVRNAVIGSVKKISEKNPKPVLQWAKNYLHHEDKEIRREICHGIELRGRTHPQDILPLLKELQHDKTARVRNTLVHVLGQIAYKKGCLQTVLTDLKTWDNEELVAKAIDEIIDVHDRYKNFSFLTQAQAKEVVIENGF